MVRNDSQMDPNDLILLKLFQKLQIVVVTQELANLKGNVHKGYSFTTFNYLIFMYLFPFVGLSFSISVFRVASNCFITKKNSIMKDME